MFPHDRVLVGVINRKKDLTILHEQLWYRIPKEQMEDGVYAEYIAFYLSGSAARGRGSGIHLYAKKTGLELAQRRVLLPDEVTHKNADNEYYQVQVGNIVDKLPAIINPTKRSISFIWTTWDRFIKAQVIRDLYSDNDYFVDRIYHALRDKHIRPLRYWEAQQQSNQQGSQLRIICENGTVTASTNRHEGMIFMDKDQKEDQILASIRRQIAEKGGPVTIHLPLEGNEG